MIAAVGLSKRYGANLVLKDVSCRFDAGMISAVLGGNGAGKSTLLSMLGGAVPATTGTVSIGTLPHPVRSVRDALRQGIRFIHQEGSLVPAWRVAEHFDRPQGWHSLAPWVQGDVPVERLTQYERQLLEVAKAIDGTPRVILADEPTAGLLAEQRERVMQALHDAAQRGAAVVLVTHDLAAARTWAQRILVLRDHHIAEDRPAGDFSESSLLAALGNHTPQPPPSRTLPAPDVPPVLTVQFAPDRAPVSVRSGEIVGIAAGLKSGAADCLRQAAGLAVQSGVTVRVDVPPEADGRRTLAYMSRERSTEWDFAMKSVTFNIAAGRWAAGSGWFIEEAGERAATASLAERFGVVAPSMEAPIEALSGGNRQKVVLARMAAGRPHIIMLDEPFSGVDVRTRAVIAGELRSLAANDTAIVIFSHEWADLCMVTDRVAIVRDDGETVERPSSALSVGTIAALLAHGETPGRDRRDQ